MADLDWATFLRTWNDELLDSPLAEGLPAEVRVSGWLGFPPATDDEIADAERRLKIPLPPSHRAFLKVSSGWRRTTFAIERVWGTQQINWFRKKHRDWIAAYTVPSMWEPHEETPDEEYFAYDQFAADFRSAHLKETLQISEVGDAAVYLLNPQVIDREGEWEAWFLANWMPGVHRYRSFRELMEAEYASFAGQEWKQPAGVDAAGLPEEYVGSPGSAKRRVKPRKVRKPGPPTEVLLAALEYGAVDPGLAPKAPRSAAAAMMRALNELPASSNPIRELGRRRGDPRVVDALVALLQREPNVRQDVAEALGKLRDPRAIEPLLGLLHDDSASTSAIYALRVIAPDRLREPLLQLLRNRHFVSFACAASVLGQMGETRAIPILVDAMRDCEGNRKYDAQLAGKLLAEFGRAGYDALVEMLRNETGVVRQLAATGLLSTNSPDAADIFRNLLDDPDPAIRETAEVAIKVLPRRRK